MIKKKVVDRIPEYVKNTAIIRLFGLTKIPLLWFLRPSVVSMDSKQCVVKIPLTRRSKNHLNSMYFGALCAGADCAAGFMAMREIQKSGKKISLSFKDFHAKFFKRAEGATYFTNSQGEEVAQFVQKVIENRGQRFEKKMKVVATVPKKLGQEPVAEFELTLSLKCKN